MKSKRFSGLKGKDRLPWSTAATLLILGLTGTAVHAQKVIVRTSVKHDVSPPLREIEGAPPNLLEIKKEVTNFVRPGWEDIGYRGADPVLQDWAGDAAMAETIQNFEGIAKADHMENLTPPDPNGDVGPNHYVQMVNKSFAIWDKAGTRLFGPVPNNNLWKGFGTSCEDFNRGDPIVLYDHLADRWLMSQFSYGSISGPFYECIAISQTGDPTGEWHRYAFMISEKKFNDYPKLGVWPDGYYMSLNQFGCVGFCPFVGAAAVVFERDAMMRGEVARMVYVDLETDDPTLFGMLPSDLDGPPPPAGTPNFFGAIDDSPDEFQIWSFQVDWTDPTSSSFTLTDTLTVAEFNPDICSAFREQCIDQPDPKVKLEALHDRLMHRFPYRNFGSHQTLIANHTVDADGTDLAGIRWYELRRTGQSWSVYQQGTYAPDSDHRWMGSIAMDGAGNVALGYSVSSTTTFPSIRYTGRLAGDPLDTLSIAEETIRAGNGAQDDGHRWGDYTMMTVDPVDDLTFWYTNEYYSADGTEWQTRIASFRFAGNECSPPATGDWIVTESCTFTGTATAAADIVVQNNAELTIATGASLSLDFTQHHLLVKHGSRVIVKLGAKLD